MVRFYNVPFHFEHSYADFSIALADLNHRNVVRYFDSWIEAAVKSSQKLIGNGTFTASDSESSSDLEEDVSRVQTIDDLTSGMDSLQIGLEQQLKLDDCRRRRKSQRNDESGMIVFETTSSSTHASVSAAKLNKSSSGSKSHKRSLFRKPSEIESDSEGMFSGSRFAMLRSQDLASCLLSCLKTSTS